MIDVHSHINEPVFDKDRQEVIKRAQEAGVKVIIDASTDYASGLASLELSRLYQGIIRTTLGMDPAFDDYKRISQLIRENRESIVGLGEVGMDFYRVKERREKMEEYFRKFIRLAKILSLPLIIHSRNAGREVIQMLIEEDASPVVMHAFDGRIKDALRGIEYGFYFSFPPSILHSSQKQQLAQAIPLKNILLESDAPVLGPERGGRNEPKNLLLTLSKLAELKGTSTKRVDEITESNARRIFGL